MRPRIGRAQLSDAGQRHHRSPAGNAQFHGYCVAPCRVEEVGQRLPCKVRRLVQRFSHEARIAAKRRHDGSRCNARAAISAQTLTPNPFATPELSY